MRERIINQTKIMTSTMLKFSRIAVVVTMALYAISASSTLISSSTPAQLNDEAIKENTYRSDEFFDADDYGVWNPSPGQWGRGRVAPIPHPEEKSP